MSDERYRKKLIKEFLDEVEEKLPFWLKANEDELKEVLKELEEHIEDKAEALEDTGKDRLEATQLAIAQMGKPSTIAREYKRRGTPKLYITEELFPMYLTVLKYAGLAIGLITIIVTTLRALVVGLTGGDWLAMIGQGFSGLLISTLVVAAGITAVFVWLSYEGFFPEDIKNALKSKKQREAEKLQPPKVKIEKPSMAEPKQKLPRGVDKPQSLIAGGIVTMVFGIIAIWQPFGPINAVLAPEFSDFMVLLTAIGAFWVVLGMLGIVHGAFSSWSYRGNQAMLPIRAVVGLFAIGILGILLANPQMFPIVWWSGSNFVAYHIGTEFYWIYYLVLVLCTIGTIVVTIYKIVCAAMLKEEDFFFEGVA